MIIDYLKKLTFLGKEEIEELEIKNNEHPEFREAHKALAREINTYLHGVEEYERAVRISESLFSGNVAYLSYDEIKEGFKGVPSFDIDRELTLIDLLVTNNICSSRREAREFISAGSITLNGEKMTDENLIITRDLAIDSKVIIIRRGKKKYYVGNF